MKKFTKSLLNKFSSSHCGYLEAVQPSDWELFLGKADVYKWAESQFQFLFGEIMLAMKNTQLIK